MITSEENSKTTKSLRFSFRVGLADRGPKFFVFLASGILNLAPAALDGGIDRAVASVDKHLLLGSHLYFFCQLGRIRLHEFCMEIRNFSHFARFSTVSKSLIKRKLLILNG